MARLGVSFQKVATVCEQIKASGHTPTIEKIRVILGTGSSTTIANHLRQWKASQERQKSLTAEAIPDALMAMMKGLWQSVLTEAQVKFNAKISEHQETITTLEVALSKYKTSNRRWQQMFTRWLNEKNELQTKIANLSQTNQALNLQVELMNQQLTQVQTGLNAMSEQNKTLTNEKWLLAQEKAELKSELKHIHKRLET